MKLNQAVCGIIGHKPYRPMHKHSWHLWCYRCGKELVAHNPVKNVAPYKIEPKGYIDAEGNIRDVQS